MTWDKQVERYFDFSGDTAPKLDMVQMHRAAREKETRLQMALACAASLLWAVTVGLYVYRGSETAGNLLARLLSAVPAYLQTPFLSEYGILLAGCMTAVAVLSSGLLIAVVGGELIKAKKK